MTISKSSRVLRGAVIFWTLFIGLGALGGGLCMLIDPSGEASGMAGLLPGLRKLPFANVLFQNLVFSGIMLIVCNCLTQALAFFAIIRRSPRAPLLACLAGIVLMLWICIQFIIFPLNFLSTAYFIFGMAELLCAIFWRRA